TVALDAEAATEVVGAETGSSGAEGVFVSAAPPVSVVAVALVDVLSDTLVSSLQSIDFKMNHDATPINAASNRDEIKR
ncbi:MAG: hypothetical protein V7695_20560, partial [Sulfitobacter sp.]